jgi:two-component sensor histidine kinase
VLAVTALEVADGTVGVVLLVCAAVARWKRPDSRTGIVLGVGCLAWFAGDVWPALLFVHRAPLVVLLLTYPAPTTRRDPAIAAAAVAALAPTMALGPVARSPGWTSATATVLVGLAAVAVGRSAGTLRRARLAALTGAAGLAAVLLAGAWNRAAEAGLSETISWAYLLAVAAIVVGLVVDLLRRRWVDAVATSLITDLGGRAERGSLTGLLARAIGDPDLVVGFDAGDGTGDFVDEAGRQVSVDLAATDRHVSVVEDAGRQVAVLVHARSSPVDPALARTIEAAVRLSASNARLHAHAQRQVTELQASRRRLVEAADGQQRRVRAELLAQVAPCIDAATAGFEAVAPQLDAAVAQLVGEITERLRAAASELDELADGLPPRVLAEQGLEQALRELVLGLPFGHRLSVDVPTLPPAVEAAVYFLCAEALTNVVKHAGASAVHVVASRSERGVEVRISDDGRGGASVGAGSGLRGIADRVSALGGRLIVRSTPGSGTELSATLPVPA